MPLLESNPDRQHASPIDMEQFVLFGDSITRQVYSQQDDGFNFGSALHDHYGGRIDVINRGHSGYNSAQALKVTSRILPTPSQARVRLLLIFFGANDARIQNLPAGPEQGVALEEYEENLRKIIHHPTVQAHQDVKIVLITPPPLDERKTHELDISRYPALGDRLLRTSVDTARYAQAVRDLGRSEKLPVLDIWTVMMQRANASPTEQPLPGSLAAPVNETLQRLLPDGLHLSGQGYRVLYDELLAVIERDLPELSSEKLPRSLPEWYDKAAWEHFDSTQT